MTYFSTIDICMIFDCKNKKKILSANDTIYRKIKQVQQLHVDFKDYAGICIKSFNKVEKEPNQ